MEPVAVGDTPLDSCAHCHGSWIGVVAFEQLCADADRQRAVLDLTAASGGTAALDPVRYGPCPECTKIMNRTNFARSSGVVIDICKAHGAWLDAEELRRVIEFLRAGGMDRSLYRERVALEEELRLLRLRQSITRNESRRGSASDRDDPMADSVLMTIFSLFST